MLTRDKWQQITLIFINEKEGDLEHILNYNTATLIFNVFIG